MKTDQPNTPVYLNAHQLSRAIGVPDFSTRISILTGRISADARLDSGRPLFRKDRLEEIRQAVCHKSEVIA